MKENFLPRRIGGTYADEICSDCSGSLGSDGIRLCLQEFKGDFYMLKKTMYGLLTAMLISSGVAIAQDAPTLDQVYKATQAGKLDEAQRMMDVVLQQHPDSAKAHFVEAEILARQGQTGRAEAELNNAERLKPGLSFANPQAVQDLKNRIGASRHVSPSSAASFQPAERGSTFPWGLLLIGAGVIAILFFIMRAVASRNTASRSMAAGNYQSGMQAPAPMQPYGQPYGGGMGPMTSGGGMAGGIMGGLATGAAVGVGMVAGEALAHHFMDGGASSPGVAPVADSWGDSSGNMGGADFGIADNSSWDDSSNIADSGDSGSDWG